MSASVKTFRKQPDLREVDGTAGLASLTAGYAIKALDAGCKDFYAHPGGLIVGTGRDLIEAARKEWAAWRDQLRAQLGGSAKKRNLASSSQNLVSQLAWRGVLVLDGEPVSWHTWTPGFRHRGYGPGIVPTIEDLRALACPIEDRRPPASPEVHRDYETAVMGEARIPVYGRGSDDVVGHARVDRGDAVRVSRHLWEMASDSYVVMRGSGGLTRLHTFVMRGPAPEGHSWDHRNRDRFDNRRMNLAAATPKEQAANRGVRSDSRSGVKGLTLLKDGRWRLRLTVDGKRIARYFATRDEAVAATSSV